MSKSLGNVIAPEDILKKYGADILRIWVASSNYAEDLRIDYGILDQHADSYRKIRNTFRYILGNLNDEFDLVDLNKLEIRDLPELEQFILHKIYLIDLNFKKNFRNYDFHNLYKELLNFCTADLSAFYFDIRKDTLYCEPKSSKKRKSTTLVLKIILNALLNWFAPILSFTTEEIFKLITNKKSIHLENFIDFPNNFKNDKLFSKWRELIELRNVCNLQIEKQRAEKIIGSSLESELRIKLSNDKINLFKDVDFAEICITSLATVEKSENDLIEVKAIKAQGVKCPVCWKISPVSCIRHGTA